MPASGSTRRDTKLYDLLGVSPDSTPTQITKAYKVAAMKYHPDRNPDAPPEKFKEISAAYDVLKDQSKRDLYDRYGLDGLKEGMGASGGSMRDIFDLLMNHGHSGHRHDDERPKGASHVIPLKVTLETLYNGETKHVPVDRKIICAQCQGTGGRKQVRCRTCHGQGVHMGMTRMGPLVFQQPVTCRDCHGQGEVILQKDRCHVCHGRKVIEDQKLLDVVILPGFADGKKIKYRGEFHQMPGMEAGDVIVVLRQEKHPIFERVNGDDLSIQMKISLAESLTGFQRLIQHLDGRHVLLQHPANQPIAPNTFKRINNQGMISMESHHTGDLIIHFDVEFPPANFLLDPSLVKTLEALLPPKQPVSMPSGSSVDEASAMIECEQQPRSTTTTTNNGHRSHFFGHHHEPEDDDNDDDYMDDDDDHPGVHTCHTQ